jgi:hypothetical protein
MWYKYLGQVKLWRGVLALMILIWGMSVKYKKVLIAKEKVG